MSINVALKLARNQLDIITLAVFMTAEFFEGHKAIGFFAVDFDGFGFDIG